MSKKWITQWESQSPAGTAWRMAADASIAVVACLLAVFVRLYAGALPSGHIPSGPELASVLAFMLRFAPFAITALLLAGLAAGVYVPTVALRARRRLRLTLAVGAAAVVSFTGLYFVHLNSIYRGPLVLFWLFCWLLLLLSRGIANTIRRNYYIEPRQKQRRAGNESVLVVGGAGYLGSMAVRELLSRGYRVRVLDSLIFGDDSIRDVCAQGRCELFRSDFRDAEAVVEAVRGMDAVIHLGALVGDPACALDPASTMSNNYFATKMIADISRGFGVRRLVFASTCSVYGATEEVATERTAPAPVSLYAATKVDSEKLLLGMSDAGFHPVVLRFATAFGLSCRPRFDLVVNLFAAQAFFDGRIRVLNPEQYRPFIHVKDIASAIATCIDAPERLVGGQIFNVGSDRLNHSIGELGEIVRAAVPGLNVVTDRNNEDPRNYKVSFVKARSLLGFECRVTLEAGIAEFLDAFRAGRIADYRDPVFSNVLSLKQSGLRPVDVPSPAASEGFMAGAAAKAGGR